MKQKSSNPGFTLIEILIVVALLGALTIGLLATLDPFQQIRKGADSARRTMASDLYRAFIAYQATKGSFPWTADVPATLANDTSMTDGTTGYITALVNSGELKSNFITAAGSNLGKLYVTSTDTAGVYDLNVCYLPESKSFANDPAAIYDSAGADGLTCIANGLGSDTCYICIK
ncbi:MAG: hypothetical protein UV73_C0009G0040 [Candidatus Gottesmanbacteria bacterium GW2011_GWA2_43_14]|uniref:Prepilin-type N-terminal cleavage/methylation domain-containing protein n=1 Tax=Candidatus Gottesmanbacteria bacterium GW2011_GWA2_43_14 TaxID=1618443 RepID=A0A0G1DGA1_9BACT|nr:MAG: hypothetical protein UV73_C0009G0040 [Candidatus Gottesmanbacteria bacterium GW2011_GWA2_43_14]